jgi:GT2 family glycosyltransferase
LPRSEVTEVDFAPGACLILRRETWQAVGPFDASFEFFFEDVEWCLRLRAQSGRVLVHASLTVWHEPSQSLGGQRSPRRVYLRARNGILYRALVMGAARPVLGWFRGETRQAMHELARGELTFAAARLAGLISGTGATVRSMRTRRPAAVRRPVMSALD